MTRRDGHGVTSALRRLVGDPEPFLAEVFGRRPIHVDGADPQGFDDLLPIDAVDELVTATGMRAPEFRLVRDGVTLPRSQVTRKARIGSRPIDDLIDVAAVHRELAAGASVVLQGLHRGYAPVATLCRALETTLTHPVQANAYLTPPVAQGLHLHGDPHDVFAVQTYGIKRWVVYPPGGEVPWDLTLRPGDVLYLPAGVRHAAQTVEHPSLHLTIGVHTTRVQDLVKRAVEAALAELHPDGDELDGRLPAGWANDPRDLALQVQQHLKATAERLTEPGRADDAVHRGANAFWRNRPPDLRGGLLDVLHAGTIDDDTPVRVRPQVTCQLQDDDGRLRVVLDDRVLHMPGSVRATLERILALDTFAGSDLAPLIDEQSRVVLVRRLVREGLLTLARDRAPRRA